MYKSILLGAMALVIGIQPQAWPDTPPVLKAGVQKDYVLQPGVIGMDILVKKNQYPLVKELLPGLPASYSGLRKNDRILRINHTQVLGKRMEEIDAMISDIPGDEVMFLVQRGEQTRQYVVTVMALDNIRWAARRQYRNKG